MFVLKASTIFLATTIFIFFAILFYYVFWLSSRGKNYIQNIVGKLPLHSKRDIRVDSTSNCQRSFIDKIQCWNYVGFGLTLKTILFFHNDAWKNKIFILTLKM